VDLARGRYEGFNHHHLTELLAEQEGLVVSRSSVWRILTAAGLKSSRHRRPAKHRCRRERYSQEGMLLQIDGSQHDWLEGRGPYLTLVAAIDDATGTVAGAVFRDQEDAQGYFLMLREVISANGVPLALYSDRHSIFQRSPKERETLEEQLAGERQPTQFGRSLKELGIQAVFALSPQAKGRIERLFGTLQDRLVSELRLAGAATMEMANQTLQDFLPRFNVRFGVPASCPGAYRRGRVRIWVVSSASSTSAVWPQTTPSDLPVARYNSCQGCNAPAMPMRGSRCRNDSMAAWWSVIGVRLSPPLRRRTIPSSCVPERLTRLPTLKHPRSP
jgi:hypothetical protein